MFNFLIDNFMCLLSRLLPEGSGWQGFVLAALLGAVVSTLAAMLNAASTILTMDLYRPYLAPAASQARLVLLGRMGVGMFMEKGGNDDYLVTRASGTLGHDTGVAWFIDEAGDDQYAGELNYGFSLTNGLTFFLERGGADTYTLPPGKAADPNYAGFGFVYDAADFAKRVGMFMDLGGGMDTYVTARPDVKNGATWYPAPTGMTANPQNHKGIGIDK